MRSIARAAWALRQRLPALHYGLQAAARTPSQSRNQVMWSKNISASASAFEREKKRRQLSLEDRQRSAVRPRHARHL